MMDIKKEEMSKAQKRYLIDFIGEHPDLQSGKFTQGFTFKKAQQMWKELAATLNAMVGAKKEWEKWRKTWHDLKNLTKAKGASIKKYERGTGGGPPPKEDLTEDDENILNIISEVAVEGHKNITESQASFVIENEDVILLDAEAWDHRYVSCETDTVQLGVTTQNDVYKEGDKEARKKVVKEESDNGKRKRKCAVKRSQNTIVATEKMSTQMERKIQIKEEYFMKKIRAMEKDVEVKSRIATALETIAKCLKENM